MFCDACQAVVRDRGASTANEEDLAVVDEAGSAGSCFDYLSGCGHNLSNPLQGRT